MISSFRTARLTLVAVLTATVTVSGSAQDPTQGAHEGAWSPDGKRLLFTGKGASSDDVFIADVDGSHVVQVTRDSFPDYYPAMSPDGKRIAYVSVRDSAMRLVVVDADGSNP